LPHRLARPKLLSGVKAGGSWPLAFLALAQSLTVLPTGARWRAVRLSGASIVGVVDSGAPQPRM